MGLKFNPLTCNFDLTGSGGGGGGSAFFAGEVATYADLPLDGTAALNSRWLVRTNSGTWPFSSYKQSGIYIRTATVGSSRDNDYKLTDTSFHDVMSDDAFLIFDNTDPTKAAKFDVGAQVGANQTRVITVPNKNITLDDAGDARNPTSHTHGNISNSGAVGSVSGLPLKTGTNGVIEAGSFSNTAGSFCAGDDARLSDARTPSSTLAHAASHAAAGSDPIEADDLAATGVAASSVLISNGSGGTQWSGAGDQLTFDRFVAIDGASADGTKILGDGIVFDDTTVQNTAWTGSVAASAVSGAITTSGLTQATARILGRTTASSGSIEEIQIGSGLSLSAGELSATGSGGGVTGAASSASDVLGVSGANITGVDAGSDKIVFWDDSASELTYAATTGGTFDGTTLRWPVELVIACSDEATNLTTGTAKVTFRAPYAFTLTGVRASVNTAPTGSTLIVDINEGGSTILSTKLSIDASEKTSTTAASAAVISDSAIADDAEITIDIDQIGSTIAGKGLKVVLIGTRA